MNGPGTSKWILHFWDFLLLAGLLLAIGAAGCGESYPIRGELGEGDVKILDRLEKALDDYEELLSHRYICKDDPGGSRKAREIEASGTIVSLGRRFPEPIFRRIGKARTHGPRDHLLSLLLEIDTKKAVGFVVERYGRCDDPSERWFLMVALKAYFQDRFHVSSGWLSREASRDLFEKSFEKPAERKGS